MVSRQRVLYALPTCGINLSCVGSSELRVVTILQNRHAAAVAGAEGSEREKRRVPLRPVLERHRRALLAPKQSPQPNLALPGSLAALLVLFGGAIVRAVFRWRFGREQLRGRASSARPAVLPERHARASSTPNVSVTPSSGARRVADRARVTARCVSGRPRSSRRRARSAGSSARASLAHPSRDSCLRPYRRMQHWPGA